MSKRSKRKTDSHHTDRSGGVDIDAQQVNIDGDVVGRDKIVYEAAAPIATSLHQLPPPPRDFTGREAELAELLAQAEGEGVTISGLHGMGGIGKTALALALADRLKSRYPDAQFYLDLKGAHEQKPLMVAEALAHVIRAYHPTAQLPESEAELRGLYQTVLHGQRALLLMDNAADKWQVEPLLPPASCFSLITSRQHFTLPGLHAKNLDTLPLIDARNLLLKISPRIDGHANAMAKMCGYLPLALRLAGSVIAERATLTPEDYLRRLAGEQTRLRLVEASLSLSYNLLDEEMQRAWCALSVFPATFDLAAAAAVWGVDQERAQDGLDALVRYSLVGWDATASRAHLHDLARAFADSGLSDAERAAHQHRHAAHYETVAYAAGDLYLEGGEALIRGLYRFDLDWENIQAGQAWAARHATEDDTAAQLCSDYPDAGIHMLSLRLRPRDQIRWLEPALAAAVHLKNRGAESLHLGRLGNAYYDLGEFRRAIEFHEQALGIARDMGDRHGESIHLGNLGNVYDDLGERRRAVEFHEQALAISRGIGDRRGEGRALGNLGIAHKGLGNIRLAIEFYEQALSIAREVGNRDGESDVLGNLGVAYSDLGDPRRAIEFYEQTLVIAREMGDRLGEEADLGNLGVAYLDLGEYRRASEFFTQAMAIAREMGDRHGERNALDNLGLVYADVNEPQRAIENHQQALAIAREIGDRHGEANSLSNLGNVYYDLDEFRRAVEYYDQALVIDREIGNRRGEGYSLGNLGNAYDDLGEPRRAAGFYQQQLVISREIDDRLGEGNTLWNMSLSLDKLGDRAQAVAHAEAALNIYTQIESPTAEKVRQRLAKWRE